MPRKKKTHAEYVAELAVKNPGVTVVGEYVDSRTKIEHQCVCGERWDISPDNAYKGTLCNDCGNKKIGDALRKSTQEYVAWIAENRPGLKLLGKYKNDGTPTAHRCECGEVWDVRPTAILSGKNTQCPKCGGKKKADYFSHTRDEYAAWLAEHKPWIKVLGDYGNAYSRIEHLCTRTQTKFTATPLNMKHRGSCPCCKSYRATDGDVFYVWENLNDPGVYKVGITSKRSTEDRINRCCSRNNMAASIIMMVSVKDARDIERRALELGDDPRYPDTIDGYTEFRRYSDAELAAVYQMAVQAA